MDSTHTCSQPRRKRAPTNVTDISEARINVIPEEAGEPSSAVGGDGGPVNQRSRCTPPESRRQPETTEEANAAVLVGDGDGGGVDSVAAAVAAAG